VPHIDLSMPLAIPEGENVRFGFRSIAGIKNCADTLCSIRGDEPFTGLGSMITRVHGKMKVSEIEKIIKVGCCDEWGSRLGLIKQLQDLWKMHDKRAKKKTGAVPLFDLEDMAESQEDAPQFRETDRIAMELELLAGCYREDISLTVDMETTQVCAICWTWKMVDKVIQVAKRYPGKTPLNVMFPSEERHGVWVRLGTVQNTQRVRHALAEIGCEIRE